MIRLLGCTAAALVCLSTAQAAEVVGPFDGISAWLQGAASSPADHGDTVGSVRVITLKAPGNPTVKES